MSLHTVWFIIVAFFWSGFFVLEGFDFGVGALHGFVGRTTVERRQAVNTIGPVWDGNEVWLIVAGAAIFAAFPAWYATMFSALYLAMFLILVALILRGVSFEYRGKVHAPRWQSSWRWALTSCSVAIPFLLGLALGDLLRGLPINSQHEFTGNFGVLFTAFGVYTGLTFMFLSLLSGAAFLVLKAEDPLYARARAYARWLSILTAALVIGFIIWTTSLRSGVLPNPLAIVAGVAALAAMWLVHTQHHGWAFGMASVTMLTCVVVLFERLYPGVMVSSTNAAYSLTVSNASSTSYALKVMSVVAAIFTPLVLAYQGWSYWVFRTRVGPRPGVVDVGEVDGARRPPAVQDAAISH